MLRKIAEPEQGVKPVVWRQVRTGGTPAGTSPSGETPGEVAELRLRVAELERIRHSEVAQARQGALQEGMRQGREQAAAEVKASSDRLAQTLAELANLKRKIRGEAELELLKLSLAIARRVLNRELQADPDAIQGIVHAALQKIQRREIFRVRIYPAGADAVRAALNQIGSGAIEIVPDPALKIGDLLIDTAVGELDASVDTQLQEIQRGFTDRLALR